MCGRLDSYLLKFSKIKAEKSTNTSTKFTHYKSPCKPLLLLSILDHIATGLITKNYIEPTSQLTETFQQYISLIPDASSEASIAYPFFYLKNTTFWELKPKATEHYSENIRIRTVELFQKFFWGAQFSEALYPLLKMQHSRDKIRSILIRTYFHTDIQHVIWNQAVINYKR